MTGDTPATSSAQPIKEAERLLKWAADEFEKRGISADNWYADYQLWIEYDLSPATSGHTYTNPDNGEAWHVTSGSADQAVSRAKEEVRYCYEELHGRRPLEVGYGGRLTYGDLEILIQAAEQAAALREELRSYKAIVGTQRDHLVTQNEELHITIADLEHDVAKGCSYIEMQGKENQSLRQRVAALEAALEKIRTATLSDESDRNKVYGCNIIVREALKQSEHDFMKG